MIKKIIYASAILLSSHIIHANTISVEIYDVNNKSLGNIKFQESKYGLIIQPHLKFLPPGPHGFHIHEHPDCADHAMKAGGHFDPEKTNNHLGPYNNGHLGDLPVLFVDSLGEVNTPLLAPRLKINDLKNHAVMIHDKGDNYSDLPEPLGGGGARIACGIIK